MTDNQLADRMREVFASFDAGDVPALARYMTDDIHLRLGNADALHGKTAFREAVTGFLASISGVRHEILRMFTDNDAVIVEFDVHYTRHDNVTVTLPCCNIFKLQDGLIAEYRSYIDATPVYAEAEAS